MPGTVRRPGKALRRCGSVSATAIRSTPSSELRTRVWTVPAQPRPMTAALKGVAMAAPSNASERVGGGDDQVGAAPGFQLATRSPSVLSQSGIASGRPRSQATYRAMPSATVICGSHLRAPAMRVVSARPPRGSWAGRGASSSRVPGKWAWISSATCRTDVVRPVPRLRVSPDAPPAVSARQIPAAASVTCRKSRTWAPPLLRGSGSPIVAYIANWARSAVRRRR